MVQYVLCKPSVSIIIIYIILLVIVSECKARGCDISLRSFRSWGLKESIVFWAFEGKWQWYPQKEASSNGGMTGREVHTVKNE